MKNLRYGSECASAIKYSIRIGKLQLRLDGMKLLGAF